MSYYVFNSTIKPLQLHPKHTLTENIFITFFFRSQGTRDESGKIDRAKAATDAHALFEAGTAQWGTDESEFNRVLLTNSRAQLKGGCVC